MGNGTIAPLEQMFHFSCFLKAKSTEANASPLRIGLRLHHLELPDKTLL